MQGSGREETRALQFVSSWRAGVAGAGLLCQRVLFWTRLVCGGAPGFMPPARAAPILCHNGSVRLTKDILQGQCMLESFLRCGAIGALAIEAFDFLHCAGNTFGASSRFAP